MCVCVDGSVSVSLAINHDSQEFLFLTAPTTHKPPRSPLLGHHFPCSDFAMKFDGSARGVGTI